MLDLTVCPAPDCHLPATIRERRPVLESTDGPVEHVRTDCPDGHLFFMPADMLESRGAPAEEYVLKVAGRNLSEARAIADWRVTIEATGLEIVGCPVARRVDCAISDAQAYNVHGHARRPV